MITTYMPRAALLAGLCLAASAAAAQQDPLPLIHPLPLADPVPDIVRIEADRSERMTVPVSIDGSGPYQFVVDTGAERTVISRELAGQLGLNFAGIVTLHSMSGPGLVDTVLIPRLGVSNAMVRGIRAPSLGRANIGAVGMLGIDSLQEQRILLDFKADTMTITASKQRIERRDRDEIVVTAQNRFGRLVLVDASIDDRKISVIIDTGAQTSVGNEALRRMIRRNGKARPMIPTELTSVTGGKTPAFFSTIPDIRIGGLHMNNLPVAFAEAHPFAKLGLSKKPALLLGMDGLRLFDRVSIDFANRRVRFLIPQGGARDDLLLAAGQAAPDVGG